MTTTTQGRRAANQQRTRERIVEATVALHTSVGPARTSISAIAERAGVQRHTVYAHFPDEASLFTACTGLWIERNPPPDPGVWAEEPPGAARVRAALDAVSAYYAAAGDDMATIMADRDRMAAVAEQLVGWDAMLGGWADLALAGSGLRGRRRVRARAAMLHALQLETWRSLTASGGLSRAEAVDLLTGLVGLAMDDVRPARSRGSAA